jgi:hypothetical protein
MTKNAAKANFTLEKLNRTLLPGGDARQWDGQNWFLAQVHENPALLNLPYIKDWKPAADSLRHYV